VASQGYGLNTMLKKGAYTHGDVKLCFDKPNINVTIGKFCSIADNVSVDVAGEHRTDVISTFSFKVYFPQDTVGADHTGGLSKGGTTIGNDVWICEGVRILSGVTIGDGAVLGSRSVVAKDVPSYAVVVGNPARVVRYRFSPEIIKKLLEIKWWDWPIEKIRKNARILMSSNLEALFKAAKEA